MAFIATLLLPLMLIYARAGIEVCCFLIGISFLWQSLQANKWRWLQSPFMPACVVLWLYLVLIVTPLALFPKAGLMEALLWFRLPLMFASLRYWVLAQPAARTTVGLFLGVLLTLIALDCVVQFFTGMSLSGHATLPHARLSGPFQRPQVGLYMAQLIVPAVAFCLGAALMLRRRCVVMALLLLAGVIITIVMTGERSAFLVTLLACGTTLGLVMLTEKRLRLAGLGTGIILLGAVGVLYAMSATIQLRAGQMFDTMGHYQQSDYGQLAAVAIGIGKQHIAHGVGLHGFRELCPILEFHGESFRGLHPHNIYLELFAEAGLPGLILLLALIVILLREGVQHYRRAKSLDKLMPAMAIGLLLQHFFPLVGMQSFFTNWGAMLQWFSLSLMFAALPSEDSHA